VVERVERRGRLSVAFRLLLILPQVVVLYVLWLVGSVALVVGWFAALVLGRLPEPIARYLCHLTGYSTRVLAYGWLLTDRYPPFRLSAEDYPVGVALAPGRLNRLAVLFRLFLAIPASILSGLAVAGWAVAGLVIWLVVLVAGRVPGPLFDATTAVLRYWMRYNAYLWLVTAAYPWGLFGDRPAPPGLPEPAGGLGPAGAPEEAVPGAATPAGPTQELEPAGVPRGLLVLSGRAKRLVVLFVVLGVAQWVAGGVGGAITASNAPTSTEALSGLTAAHDTLAGQTQQFRQQAAACRSAADQLGCVESATGQLADAFEAFATEVDALGFPGSAQDEAAELVRRTHGFAGALRSVAAASSPAEYTRLAAGINQLGNSLDQQYRATVAALSG
jgi:hypothetical protein